MIDISKLSVPVAVYQVTAVENGTTKTEEVIRRFGLLSDNRKIDLKKVDKFIGKIEENRYYSEYPIMCYEAEKLAAIGKEITDFEGDEIPADKLPEYLIIADGQHRFAAFIGYNEKNPKNKKVIPNVKILSADNPDEVLKFLVAVNTAGSDWTNNDRWQIAGNLKNQFADKVIGLINDYKFSQSTSQLIYLGKRLSAKQFSSLLNGDLTVLDDIDDDRLEIGDKFLDVALEILKGNDTKMKLFSKRYYIQGFDEYTKGKTYDETFEAMKKLNIEDLKKVKSPDDFKKLLKSVR